MPPTSFAPACVCAGVSLQLSKQQIKSLIGFFVAQAFGILAPRLDAVTVFLMDLTLAHQEEVLGALGWI